MGKGYTTYNNANNKNQWILQPVKTDQKLICRSGITILLSIFFYYKTKSWTNARRIYLMFLTRDNIQREQTNGCLFRFGATGQLFKIKHTDVVAFTNFGAKIILIYITPLHFQVYCFPSLFPFNFLSSFCLV